MPSTFANIISKIKKKRRGTRPKRRKKKQADKQTTEKQTQRKDRYKQRQTKTAKDRKRETTRESGLAHEIWGDRRQAGGSITLSITHKKRVQNHMHGLNKVLFLNAPTSSSMNGKEYEYPVHL